MRVVVKVADGGHRGLAVDCCRRVSEGGRKQASEMGKVVRVKTPSAGSGELASECFSSRKKKGYASVKDAVVAVCRLKKTMQIW